MLVDNYTYRIEADPEVHSGLEAGDELEVHIFCGEILRELTPLGNSLTWVIERIGEDELELSRGATRQNVYHGVVRSGFQDGTLVVGEPCSKGLVR
jgi:hypothetical protein